MTENLSKKKFFKAKTAAEDSLFKPLKVLCSGTSSWRIFCSVLYIYLSLNKVCKSLFSRAFSHHVLLTCFCFCLLHQPSIFAPELIPAKTNGHKMKSNLHFFTKKLTK